MNIEQKMNFLCVIANLFSYNGHFWISSMQFYLVLSLSEQPQHALNKIVLSRISKQKVVFCWKKLEADGECDLRLLYLDSSNENFEEGGRIYHLMGFKK